MFLHLHHFQSGKKTHLDAKSTAPLRSFDKRVKFTIKAVSGGKGGRGGEGRKPFCIYVSKDQIPINQRSALYASNITQLTFKLEITFTACLIELQGKLDTLPLFFSGGDVSVISI